MKDTFNLKCSWQTGLDIGGLSKEDQERISKIGLFKWMDEITTGKKSVVKKGVAATTTGSTHPLVTQNTPKPGTKAFTLATAFLKIAKEHGNNVTYEQAKILHPSYPTDPAYYARLLGADIETDRKNKIFRVKRYA